VDLAGAAPAILPLLRPYTSALQLLWLDLSFNRLGSLAGTQLAESFPNLQVLYLHANALGEGAQAWLARPNAVSGWRAV
jgi:hypothetical protein